MNKRNALKLIAGGAGWAGVAATLGLGLSACSEAKPSFNAVDITGADYARDFSLKDADGKLRTLADFKGKVVVLFFGYAQCPDVCPTTMTEMAQVKQQLGSDGDKLQVLFVTVDPARDTPEVLKAYMGAFDPAFVALIPTADQLAQLAKDFKVYYKKVEGKTPTSYSMDHSAASFVYDTDGRLRLYARYGAGAAPMVSDVKALLKS
ncbi:protein SCO1/2 [Variovorax beijingensis]|uniref:Protein SCO1/2 n=2 Tax=Variovorax TaxID=34072 RepID=A0AAE3XZD1_VARPD|nr:MULTISPECIES: SCO family protein [Variovorax]MBD9662596.1 SCO family protein [Variovorax sp. VRV01]MDR6427094.1 protein SCO1/2 [Variovorax paradoxus]MDR6451002.1 protein SCO1/2 [Variovorax paradoxus]TWD91430.1 protein SCO1/2 [Variovorax beijingensis]